MELGVQTELEAWEEEEGLRERWSRSGVLGIQKGHTSHHQNHQMTLSSWASWGEENEGRGRPAQLSQWKQELAQRQH